MNKIVMKVPSEVKYISDWEGYKIPQGKCIIDKGLTGCGFTEYCLRNDENIILCSPRRLLLENKVEQHLQDRNILYLRNDGENMIVFDNDGNEIGTVAESINQTYTDHVLEFYKVIEEHINRCIFSNLPIKFLVTYDSLHYFTQFLGTRISNFKIVVDEFTSLFMDVNFKPNVDLGFTEELKDCPNVCYVSATPYMEEDMNHIEVFKDLDFYQFDWSDSPFIERVKVERFQVKNLKYHANKVIQEYLSGKFPVKMGSDGVLHESRELVLYFNSVTDIVSIIKSNKLTSDNTTVICSNTAKNQAKLKKVKMTIGKPNTKENRHLNKMFTFCTKTVYLGADFYSDNAKSYVFSNPNIYHLAVDIALDLPQILGRQRMSENPWKNECVLYFKTLNKDNIVTYEDFLKIVEGKLIESGKILDNYTAAPQRDSQLRLIRQNIEYKGYLNDYIGVGFDKDKDGKIVDYHPTVNELVLYSEKRAWKVCQSDYLKDYSVRAALMKEKMETKVEVDQDMMNAANMINSSTIFSDAMKIYCDYVDSIDGNPYKIGLLNNYLNDSRYENYYSFYKDTQIIRGKGYHESRLKTGMIGDKTVQELAEKIYQTFEVGKRYTNKHFKSTLASFYKELGITKTPKANDIAKYFVVKPVLIISPGKKEHGFELLTKIQ